LNRNNGKNQRPGRGFGLYLAIFALVLLIVYAYQGSDLVTSVNEAEPKEVEFSDMVNYLESENVASIKLVAESRRYEGTLKDGSRFIAYAPSSYDMAVISETYLIPMSTDGLKVESVKPSNTSALLSWIPTLLMIGFMVFLWISLSNGAGAGGRGVMSFGKTRARAVKDSDKKVMFDDVAGLEEEKTELAEIVDFLKDPGKYTELGARIPKGVLLVGPPGTGKTYISKAVAGEANVPFFSISGSDFVEMFVGVGASRVRDLFGEAKKNAPCIVFIDEIDAVGRRRGAGLGGGNDEREQTLNQLLVEMDGFGQNEGIIVLAATNRPDVLDPAILRPGRFDRQVVINTPDIKGREAVFRVHSKDKPLGDDVDLKVLAKRTPGFTPADIENMMNEAALLTARRGGSKIHMDDLEEAVTRVMAGPEKKSRVISEKERRLTAFHEAGHAVVMRSLPDADPVHQITIMPRGMAGGFTMSLPEEDRYYHTKSQMEHDIMHLLGGRIAESQILGDISTGASNDLERSTKIAHDMVVKYGMSEAVGPLNYSSSEEVFLGRDLTTRQNFSEALASKIDTEVRRIIDDCYAKTEALLKEHQDELNRVAEALLRLETIDGEQFEALYNNTKTLDEIAEEEDAEKAKRLAAQKAEAEEKARADAEKRSALEASVKERYGENARVVYMDEKGRPVAPPYPEFKKQEEPEKPAEPEAPVEPEEPAEPEQPAEPAEPETKDEEGPKEE
jgi:cell division protease FtsH